jgi:hypothetical protein
LATIAPTFDGREIKLSDNGYAPLRMPPHPNWAESYCKFAGETCAKVTSKAFILQVPEKNNLVLGTIAIKKFSRITPTTRSQYRLELRAIATQCGAAQNFDYVSGGPKLDASVSLTFFSDAEFAFLASALRHFLRRRVPETRVSGKGGVLPKT